MEQATAGRGGQRAPRTLSRHASEPEREPHVVLPAGAGADTRVTAAVLAARAYRACGEQGISQLALDKAKAVGENGSAIGDLQQALAVARAAAVWGGCPGVQVGVL